MKQLLTLLLICLVLILADLYLIRGVRIGLKKWKFSHKKAFGRIYWTLSLIITAGVFISVFAKAGLGFRAAFLLIFFLLVFCKVLFLPFMLADDIRRLIVWYRQRSKKDLPAEKTPIANAIPRSEFLMKAGLLAGSIP